jgi:NADH-quinone oxidoreductase subunit H
MLLNIIETVIKILAIIVPLLIAVAYVTLAERKIFASMQLRVGPNVVGVWGLLQPLADGVKLFTKETILPTHANLVIFLIAPVIALTLALLTWGVIPYGEGVVLADLNIGVLYLLAVSSISVYAVLMSGWSSNSKYAFFGAIRAAAQMISYEVSMGLIIISVLLCVGSLNLTSIVTAQAEVWFFIPLFPAMVMFFVSALAETNRTPFDLTEGESELVSGYNVEYSAMAFALFFLAEYAHIILMSLMTAVMFFGGWLPPLNIAPFTWVPPYFWLALKTTFFIFMFIWVRATFPRMRYDQLMALLWKSYLPLSLAFVVLVASILIAFDGLPV